MSFVEDRDDDEYGEEEEDHIQEQEKQQNVVIVEPIHDVDQEVGSGYNMIPPDPFPFSGPSPSYHQLLAPAGDIRDPSRSTPAAAPAAAAAVRKEHMFDKVVTPSDVGKLNRLVIPKQHAEKYFPLDSSVNEKGLLLSFEDRGGKQWRFRYSYWNSSQSYVMTKGWSRFVRDKKLDAGDIVTFERGLGLDHDRLFIDWKRRPSLNPPSRGLPAMPPYRQAPWGRVFFPTMAPAITHLHHVHPQMNYGYGASVVAPQGFLYNIRMPGAAPAGGGGGGDVAPMVLESVPEAHTAAMSTSGKRFRLFGVNLDCPDQESNERRQRPGLELELYNGGESPTPSSSSSAREVPRKEKQSLSLDLDI